MPVYTHAFDQMKLDQLQEKLFWALWVSFNGFLLVKNEMFTKYFSLFLFLVRTQIIQPPADTRVLLGLTASLQCKVSSDASVPYNIDWYREGQPNAIMNSQRVGVQADGTLEITAVRAADVGVYSCMVSIILLES